MGRLEEEETQLPPVPGTVAELLVVVAVMVAAVTAVRGEEEVVVVGVRVCKG